MVESHEEKLGSSAHSIKNVIVRDMLSRTRMMRSRYRGRTICGVDQISERGKRFRLRSHIFRSDFPASILSDSSAPEELVSLVYEICLSPCCKASVSHQSVRSAIYLGPAMLWLRLSGILICRVHLWSCGFRS